MIFFAAWTAVSKVAPIPDTPERSDVIIIQTLKMFGRIERPPVAFPHDMHTQVIEKMGKDCQACHPQEDASGRLSIKYRRLQDADKQFTMDAYHAGCISCHNERFSAGETSGPVVCAGCHSKAAKTVSNRKPFGMDKSLHFRHIKTTKGGCGACHHEYDAAAKKRVYVRGNESSCRYCHLNRAEENRMSMREASHVACIGCHSGLAVQGKSTGPMECAGCHDAARQASIEKLARVPRIKTRQPDTVFVKAQASEEAGAEAVGMNPVPFDHKAHEAYNDTCRVCHHASLTGCIDCHTVPGKKEGAWINLEQAMHRSGAEAGCIGCHERKQMDTACAGCHGFMTRSRQMSEPYCSACHLKPAAREPSFEENQVSAASADEMLAARTPTISTYEADDIPEKVIIRSLSKTFEPVELPHGKIISALVKGIDNSKLAAYFHAERGTLCRGCHHNSPAAKTPPRCASCHGKPFQEGVLFRPGLMAAYHLQCMECHDQMGIEKPAPRDCTGCHLKKQGVTSGSGQSG